MGKKRDRKKPPGTVRVLQTGLDAALVKQAPPLWTASQSIDASAVKDGQATSNPSTVRPTVENGFHFEAGNSGTTGGSEPTWPTTEGGTVVDNGITWKAIVAADGKMPAEAKKDQMVRDLLAHYDETGEEDYLKAARIIRRNPNHRPTAGDALKLRRMLALIERGRANSDHEAARIVAAEDPGHSIEATIDRLGRKIKRWRRCGFRGKPPT